MANDFLDLVEAWFVETSLERAESLLAVQTNEGDGEARPRFPEMPKDVVGDVDVGMVCADASLQRLRLKEKVRTPVEQSSARTSRGNTHWNGYWISLPPPDGKRNRNQL